MDKKKPPIKGGFKFRTLSLTDSWSCKCYIDYELVKIKNHKSYFFIQFQVQNSV